MYRSSLLLARFILIGLLFGVPTLSHAATFYLNYSELLPGTTQYQSQYNGWNTPSSYSVKDIITPEYISAYNNSTTPSGCRRITTTSVVGRYFIPTRTLAEWDSFRTFTPPGITINYCPVDARCSTTANTCLAGTPSGFSAPTCGGTATWTCNGLYGGSSVSCSTPNTPCPSCGAWVNTCNNGSPENMNGGSCGGYSTWSCRWGRLNTDTVSCSRYNAACYWTTWAWWSCSASCGGWWQYRSVACYDPRGYTVSSWNCSGAMPSTSQQCNTQPCAVNCSASWTYQSTATICEWLVRYDIYRYNIYTYPSGGWFACETYNGATRVQNYRVSGLWNNGWYFDSTGNSEGCHLRPNKDGLTEWYCSNDGTSPPPRPTAWSPKFSAGYCGGITTNCWHRCVNP